MSGAVACLNTETPRRWPIGAYRGAPSPVRCPGRPGRPRRPLQARARPRADRARDDCRDRHRDRAPPPERASHADLRSAGRRRQPASRLTAPPRAGSRRRAGTCPSERPVFVDNDSLKSPRENQLETSPHGPGGGSPSAGGTRGQRRAVVPRRGRDLARRALDEKRVILLDNHSVLVRRTDVRCPSRTARPRGEDRGRRVPPPIQGGADAGDRGRRSDVGRRARSRGPASAPGARPSTRHTPPRQAASVSSSAKSWSSSTTRPGRRPGRGGTAGRTDSAASAESRASVSLDLSPGTLSGTSSRIVRAAERGSPGPSIGQAWTRQSAVTRPRRAAPRVPGELRRPGRSGRPSPGLSRPAAAWNAALRTTHLVETGAGRQAPAVAELRAPEARQRRLRALGARWRGHARQALGPFPAGQQGGGEEP